MKVSEVNKLATYNSETSRGIVHTEEWKARMAELQRVFDLESKLAAQYGSPIVLEPDAGIGPSPFFVVTLTNGTWRWDGVRWSKVSDACCAS